MIELDYTLSELFYDHALQTIQRFMWKPSLFDSTLKHMVYCSRSLHKTYTDQDIKRLLQNKKRMKVNKIDHTFKFPRQHSRLPRPHSRFPRPHSRFPRPHSRLPRQHSRFPRPQSRLPRPHLRLPRPHSRFTRPQSVAKTTGPG